MYSSTKPTAVHQFQSAKHHNATTSNASYIFLSSLPRHKHKPQPIHTFFSPPRSLPRSTSRRRSSISGSPAFQTSFITLTPTSDSSNLPHLTNHSYTAAFSTFPDRGSCTLETVAHIHLAPRGPVSQKRSHTSASPKRSHHRSPFAPPSPTRMRSRAKSTTRIPLSNSPPPPLTPTFNLSKTCSLINLRSCSPSPTLPSCSPSTKPKMSTLESTTKATGKRAKRSATPARGSAAFTKYRPMPFIQQMQMIQLLEGGTLDSHIRRHHVHAGQGTAYTGFAIHGKEDLPHGYSFTDERGMVWFDEEEEWEFTSLLPRTRPQRRRGLKRLLGKRRDEESGDEWEDFMEEEELDENVELEVLLAREDDCLRVCDDDLASFGGALEGPWTQGHSGSSILKLPKPKSDRKNKRTGRNTPFIPVPLPDPVPANTRCPRERFLALKEEFLSTAFSPPPVRASPFLAKPSCATGPFRSASRTLFQPHHRTGRSAPNANALAGGQSFVSLSASLRGGDVLDSTEPFSVPPSPTVQWASEENKPLLHASSLQPAAETLRRSPSPSPNPEMRLRSVSPPLAAARRLGIEPFAEVSLQPFSNTARKQTFRSLRGFKSTKDN